MRFIQLPGKLKRIEQPEQKLLNRDFRERLIDAIERTAEEIRIEKEGVKTRQTINN